MDGWLGEDGEGGGPRVGWAASGARSGERRPPLSGSGASAPEVVPLHSYPRRGLTGIYEYVIPILSRAWIVRIA